MKRHGALLAAIADPGNLGLAFWKAARGKKAKADCRAFQENLDANLSALRAELLAGRARVGDYHYFTIHDPKERRICAAHFRERVMHHALENPYPTGASHRTGRPSAGNFFCIPVSCQTPSRSLPRH